MTDTHDAPAAAPETQVQVHESGDYSFVPSAHAEILNSDGVLGTAVSAQGSTLGRPVEAGDVVSVMGVTMRVSDAVRHGYLIEEDGKFRDLTEGEASASQDRADRAEQDERERAEAPADPLSFPPESVEMMSDLVSTFETAGVNPLGVAHSLINNPTEVPMQIKAMARELGADEADLHGRAMAAGAAMEEAVSVFLVDKAGLDPDNLQTFYDWAKSRYAGRYSSAFVEAIFNGNAAPLREWVTTFHVGHPAGRGTIDPAKITRTATGRADNPVVETVDILGVGKTSLAAARRLRIG